MAHQLLSKDFDNVLLGKNIFSYIYGLKLLKGASQILILDDERLNVGKGLMGRQGIIELTFLETWGEEEGISPLQNISSYTQTRPFTFFVNNKRIRLGIGPTSNLRELARKFDEFNSLYLLLKNSETNSNEESFDEKTLLMIKRFGQNLYRSFGAHYIDIDSSFSYMPEVFKKAFQLFCDIYTNAIDSDDKLELKTLFFALRTHYQQMVTASASKMELFSLFLMVLSPSYEIKLDRLESDLAEVYFSKGGLEKKTSVREWKFHKNAPWSLELSSYEGIIHPKKVTILSTMNDQLPLALRPFHQIFRGYEIRWHLEIAQDSSNEQSDMAKQLSGLADGPILMCFNHKLGTSRPFYYMRVEDNQLIFNLPLLGGPGFKMSFAKREIRNELISGLRHMVPSLANDEVQWMISENIVETSECWPFIERPSKRILPESFKQERPKIESGNIPGKGQNLKNISYLGPSKINNLGLLSLLMELKNI